LGFGTTRRKKNGDSLSRVLGGGGDGPPERAKMKKEKGRRT